MSGPPRPPVELMPAIGCVETVHAAGRDLHIAGWLTAYDDRTFDSCAILWNQRLFHDFDRFKAFIGLPSPEVPTWYPELAHAIACRFHVVVPGVVDDHASLEDSLFAVLPRSRHYHARALVHVEAPRVQLPAQQLERVGGGERVGGEYLGHFITLGGLESGHAVLDVGCGVGRIAYYVGYFLEPTSRYEGFDVDAGSVRWAQHNLGSLRPNMRFAHLDVANSFYNPHGKLDADSVGFPYADASFDFVFLTSVFTHMRAAGVRRYFREARRTMRPDGRLFVTCFAIDEAVEARIAAGQSTHRLVHAVDEGLCTDPTVPETTIGFRHSDLVAWAADAGLCLWRDHRGDWSGGPKSACFQDTMVFRAS